MQLKYELSALIQEVQQKKRFPERQYMLLHNLFISLTDVLITHSVH